MGKLETAYAIRSILVNNATVAALVSTRIYPLFNIPQNSKIPYITYTQSGADHVHDLSGASGGAMYHIDIHCISDTDAHMRALGVAARKALDGYTGTVTVGSDSVVIEQCFLKSELDDIASPDDGSSNPIFIRQMEFAVFNKTETS